MATFSIFIEESGTLLLGPPLTTINNICETTYSLLITALPGDNITITTTPSLGYTNYLQSIFNEFGGVVPITSPYNFTFVRPITITLRLYNTATVEEVSLEVQVLNNTSLESATRTVTRESTGTIC